MNEWIIPFGNVKNDKCLSGDFLNFPGKQWVDQDFVYQIKPFICLTISCKLTEKANKEINKLG